MPLYIGGFVKKAEERAQREKEEAERLNRKRISGKLLNKAKENSYLLTVQKEDEYKARAAINREVKGVIKYQGWDEGTWTRFRFFFYSPLKKSKVHHVLGSQLSKNFMLTEAK